MASKRSNLSFRPRLAFFQLHCEQLAVDAAYELQEPWWLLLAWTLAEWQSLDDLTRALVSLLGNVAGELEVRHRRELGLRHFDICFTFFAGSFLLLGCWSCALGPYLSIFFLSFILSFNSKLPSSKDLAQLLCLVQLFELLFGHCGLLLPINGDLLCSRSCLFGLLGHLCCQIEELLGVVFVWITDQQRFTNQQPRNTEQLLTLKQLPHFLLVSLFSFCTHLVVDAGTLPQFVQE